MTSQTVNILCSCGSDKFESPRNPKASDVIICARCGVQKKYGILQKEIASKVKKKVEADFRRMLKKAVSRTGFVGDFLFKLGHLT